MVALVGLEAREEHRGEQPHQLAVGDAGEAGAHRGQAFAGHAGQHRRENKRGHVDSFVGPGEPSSGRETWKVVRSYGTLSAQIRP